MYISEIISIIEQFAPLHWQENFDNSGIQTGNIHQEAKGVLLCLDVTEAVVQEAIALNCNLIISHHPLLFHPLRKLTGENYIERCVIAACKSDIVIYAAHTNLDNAPGGVNFRLSEKIGLQNIRILKPENGQNYGSGAVGELPEAMDEAVFLEKLKNIFGLESLKHSPYTGKKIRKVALCGGSGAFLIPDAIAAGAGIFLTGEARYNDYFDVENRILLAVLGHYETEQCTKEIFFDIISEKIPNFALHFSKTNINPVNYI
ncbi:MAG: Nif3-like dinuclear metal center hexameric protein [Dysgonamonadaceae bacterium]|jgi:dinuclear metal center YbgI/SA1388 family protein|nr:Nif3-like dinuclear metal center hexameric protein [Dysgonamonadaceae bacterium]